MTQSEYMERLGDYVIREQPFEEIQRAARVPFTLCGLNPYGYFRHIRRFVAELDGLVIGDGWVMASRYNPWGYLGHWGILTETHKRKGLGKRLLALCVEALREAGMEAMFVDTGPSIAHMVYEKQGFRDVVPDHPEWVGLCYDGRTIREYLAGYFEIDEDAPVEVRPLDSSYLVEIQALLNVSADPEILVKNYLLTLFSDDQVHLGQILEEIPALCTGRSEAKQVRMLGLFAEQKLIGFATLAPWRTARWDNGREAHVGLVDLYMHPSLWRHDRCRILFEGVQEQAEKMGLCHLRAMETPRDSLKTDILITLGFRVKFEMPEEVVMGVGKPERGVYPEHRMEDLAVYELSFGQPKGFTHPYRKPWDY